MAYYSFVVLVKILCLLYDLFNCFCLFHGFHHIERHELLLSKPVILLSPYIRHRNILGNCVTYAWSVHIDSTLLQWCPFGRGGLMSLTPVEHTMMESIHLQLVAFIERGMDSDLAALLEVFERCSSKEFRPLVLFAKKHEMLHLLGDFHCKESQLCTIVWGLCLMACQR